MFHKLTEKELDKIADIMIAELAKRMKDQKIDIKVNKAAKDYIIKNGTDMVYGARPLRRAIQSMLEDNLAEAILDGKVKEGNKVEIGLKDGKISIKTKKKGE